MLYKVPNPTPTFEFPVCATPELPNKALLPIAMFWLPVVVYEKAALPTTILALAAPKFCPLVLVVASIIVFVLAFDPTAAIPKAILLEAL